MKKRIFAVILMLCLLLSACGTGPVATDPSQEPTESQAPTKPKLEPVDFKINGNELAKYTIVWAESEYALYQKMYPKFLPEKDMNLECAERLQAFFLEKCGTELEIVNEKDNIKSDYEIYVGPVTRNDLFRKLLLGRQREDDYRIVVVENRMIICGGECGTTWHALDYFEEQVEQQLSENKKVVFEDKYDYAGEYHLIKIGMVGDSITQGSGSSTAARGVLAHPNQIGRILWKDCLVYNYGQAGRTMREDHGDSYMAASVYQEALAGAKQMDIMTIMLGTNDADRFFKANGKWTDADDAQFIASCEKMVQRFYDRNNNLKFFIFNAPTCYRQDSDYVAGIPDVREAQQAAFNALKDKGFDMLGFLDVGKLTEDMALYFSDGLHPNDAGHKMLAEKIAEYLKSELLDKQ